MIQVTKTHPSIVLVKHNDDTQSVYVKNECKVFRAGAEVADTYVSSVSGDMWEIEVQAPKHNTMDQYSLRYSELY